MDQKMTQFDHETACRCGLDAAVVLQWIEEKRASYPDGWLPKADLVALHQERPYIGRTMVGVLVQRLRDVGLLQTETRYAGSRSSNRLYYRPCAAATEVQERQAA